MILNGNGTHQIIDAPVSGWRLHEQPRKEARPSPGHATLAGAGSAVRGAEEHQPHHPEEARRSEARHPGVFREVQRPALRQA